MSAPKSVVKINKDGVTYTSNVDFCQYTIKELARAAFRDVAKFLKKRFRENYYKQFNKRSGDAGRITYAKVWSSESTIKPRLEIGLPAGRRKGFYGYFQEVGSSRQPKLGILRKTVEDNVASIVEIESQYLSALQDEAEALRLLAGEDEIEVDEE